MPELAISAEKVGFLIEKMREFDVKEGVSDPDSGSNGADDNMIDVLEDDGDDAVAHEITGFINAMTEDEQIDLVALMRLGRGDGSIEMAASKSGMSCAARLRTGATVAPPATCSASRWSAIIWPRASMHSA
jgi:hypothetical protein